MRRADGTRQSDPDARQSQSPGQSPDDPGPLPEGPDEEAGRALLPVASRRRAWAAVRGELARTPWRTAAALGLSAVAAALGLVAPWALGLLVDVVARERGLPAAGAGGSAEGAAALVPVLALLVGGALAAGVASGLAAAAVARAGARALAGLRTAVVDRVLRLPTSVLERTGTGDLLARVGDDVAVVTRAIAEVVPQVLASALTVVLTAAALTAVDWRVGVGGVICLPVYVGALRWYLPRSGPLYALQRTAQGARSQALLGALQGARTVRALRAEEARAADVEARSARARDLAITVLRLFTRFASAMNLAEAVGVVAVLGTGFWLVRGGTLTVGEVTTAVLLFLQLFGPLGVLLTSFDDVQSAGASLARLAGVAQMPAAAAPVAAPAPADASVRVDGVVHRYDGGPPVLHGVDLALAPGEHVAVVGASGAGKSTLAALVAGELAPAVGRVLLGGSEVGALDPEQRRRSVVLVSQEVHVFSGRLLDDVAMAAPPGLEGAALERAVTAALEAVGAAAWVRTLPDGAATRVGEGGVALTPEQAQQLALARLVLADPAVAVLDEATAEAGSTGAAALERAARAATAGRTTLVVAHRLTQARLADRVVVMAGGRVVEVGAHDDLVAAAGPYADLWRAWSGG
ncbi:ABC transporter ATP-binding protein [uncultured Pseudokineococcus sp.]|uniref:ABC transporter ATP-binding protein n=1 Tax=uncultured Pseudokineococcus sp. TaxID=1642928 RepID=UPI0026091718|nr:ABC transporter ATP-binding protein [uncultured Pseudokineococcus sp.]